jgi:hypothetical protein
VTIAARTADRNEGKRAKLRAEKKVLIAAPNRSGFKVPRSG